MHQQARIARQGGRVAANVHNTPRRLPIAGRDKAAFCRMTQTLLVDVGQGFAQGKSAFARRIDQPFVGHAIGHEHFGRHLEQVARHELRGCQCMTVVVGVVGGVVLSRTLHQGLTAFNAQHRSGAACQRQSEVAQAAEPVDHALVRARIEQAQGGADEHAVDVRIDLGKVRGAKRHGDAEFGQAVSQLRRVRADAVHGIRPLGLQPPLHAGMLRGKGVQLVDVDLAQRLQVAQHQGRDGIATSQLNLRAGIARIQAGDERTQRQEQGADVRRQDGARAHVGDVAAFAFVKTDQHLAFFCHIPYRQTRTPAVAPGWAMDGAQHPLRPAFAQVPEVVFEHALLDGHLRGRVQVLHFAAAACACVQAKMIARRLHALRRFLMNLRERGRLPIVFAAPTLGADPFARQRAFDEHDLAIGLARHALRIQIKRLHQQPIGLGMGRRRGLMRA